jgi:hypothetical protein
VPCTGPLLLALIAVSAAAVLVVRPGPAGVPDNDILRGGTGNDRGPGDGEVIRR